MPEHITTYSGALNEALREEMNRDPVFWQCEKGGESPEHVHDFWEYAVVVEGICDCIIDGKAVRLGPGDECVIPPGIVHSGRYSTGYRAIDAFSKKRVDRVFDKNKRR